jgi:hypothetical protein
MMDYLSALHKPFSGATMLCAALLLTACEAEEPAVDMGKLVGVWELMYTGSVYISSITTDEAKETWLMDLNLDKLNGLNVEWEPIYFTESETGLIGNEKGDGSFSIVEYTETEEYSYAGWRRNGVYRLQPIGELVPSTAQSTYILKGNWILHNKTEGGGQTGNLIVKCTSSSLITIYVNWAYSSAEDKCLSVGCIQWKRLNSLPEFEIEE